MFDTFEWWSALILLEGWSGRIWSKGVASSAGLGIHHGRVLMDASREIREKRLLRLSHRGISVSSKVAKLDQLRLPDPLGLLLLFLWNRFHLPVTDDYFFGSWPLSFRVDHTFLILSCFRGIFREAIFLGYLLVLSPLPHVLFWIVYKGNSNY